jgi:acid-sensing ion channel, other
MGHFHHLEQSISCNNCLEALREIKIPLNEMFVECKFRNEVINCTEAFDELVLQNSLCYTFNGMKLYRENNESVDTGSEDWSIDEGYAPKTSLDTYPQRATSAGTQYGLTVLLRYNTFDYFSSCHDDPGFTVTYRAYSTSKKLLYIYSI